MPPSGGFQFFEDYFVACSCNWCSLLLGVAYLSGHLVEFLLFLFQLLGTIRFLFVLVRSDPFGEGDCGRDNCHPCLTKSTSLKWKPCWRQNCHTQHSVQDARRRESSQNILVSRFDIENILVKLGSPCTQGLYGT